VLVAVVILALCFGLLNGIHDAGNAIAAPVMTRAMTPGAALVLAAVFHVLGALVAGTAVAATIAGIVNVASGQLLAVVGAAVSGALVWNGLTLWWGIPCSSGHCLVGALAGAALADAGGSAVHWVGFSGLRPEGVLGVLLWLVISAALAFPLAAVGARLSRRALSGAPAGVSRSIRRAEWGTAACLAFAHGSNDSQKTMGLIATALLAGGRLTHFAVPLWVMVVSAAALTVGTSLGGWRVVRTLARRIYPLRSLDGLVSQAAASSIVLTASLVGAPVSTTDVVAPAVVGVGAGSRWHHVRLGVVRTVALSWLVTLPVSGLLAAAFLPIWRSL
jgi:PiT family inorganic phosphate transporter